MLLNRDTALTEATPQEFAETHGFRLIAEDNVAANPAIAFRVETFTPTEDFKPAKPYQDGNEQSKLLLAKPETALAVVVRGEAEAGEDRKLPARSPSRARPPRRAARRMEPAGA